MALILIRGENKQKLINAISDIEKHANLNLISSPKIIDSQFADVIVEKILNSKLKTKSNVAVAFLTKEDTTASILKIKEIHPPAHVVVVSDEYETYDVIYRKLEGAKIFKEYKSSKMINGGIIDYSVKGENRFIKNEKLNSYREK